MKPEDMKLPTLEEVLRDGGIEVKELHWDAFYFTAFAYHAACIARQADHMECDEWLAYSEREFAKLDIAAEYEALHQ